MGFKQNAILIWIFGIISTIVLIVGIIAILYAIKILFFST